MKYPATLLQDNNVNRKGTVMGPTKPYEFEYTRHELNLIANRIASDMNCKPKHAHEAVAQVVAGTSWKKLKVKMGGMGTVKYAGVADDLRWKAGQKLAQKLRGNDNA